MVEIIPAIIAQNFDEVKEKIKLVESYADLVQLDISDGIFTTMKTWPFATNAAQGKDEPERLKEIETKLNFEAHLMISEPEKEIDRWIVSGVKRILIHIESTQKLPEILEKIKMADLEAGLVLCLQTPVEALNSILISQYPNIRVIQLMGISEIGYYGHPFSDQVLPKIMEAKEKYDKLKIAVDGGINQETAPKAAQIGADILIAGSAIFGGGDAGKAIEELKKTLK